MLFSILIPAYKQRYLDECLESIISQTFQDFEVIVVDDCSPEEIGKLVLQYRDSRIKYYRNEHNCGAVDVVDNWNKCLEYASGDYVICMGDDDRLMPNCLEEYVHLITKYPGLGVYHGWTETIDEHSSFKDITAPRIEYESVYSLIWNRWNGRIQQFIGDFVFDRKKLIDKGGFYKLPLAWASDDITAVMMAEEHGIANTSSIVFQYRVSSTTISSKGWYKTKMNAIREEKKWFKEFLKKEAVDDVDKKYKIAIENCFEQHFKKKYTIYITRDIKESRIRFLYWLRHCKAYNLGYSYIFYSLIMSYK